MKKKKDGLTLDEKLSLLEGFDSWYINGNKKMNLPSLCLTDGPLGVRKKDDSKNEKYGLGFAHLSTCFPAPIVQACTFNKDLIFEVGKAIGMEANMLNVDVIYAPAINIIRDSRGGRTFEYFSEDPILTGVIASSYVNGLKKNNISACVKHFCCNNQENYRYTSNSIVSQRALREIYLKAFEYVIKNANPDFIMTSYNMVNNLHMSLNKFLLQNILRDEFKFKGLTITDYGATINRDIEFEAGIDIDMPGGQKHNRKLMKKAIKNGAIDINKVDDTINKVITLMNDKKKKQFVIDEDLFESNYKLSVECAIEGAVLLKNDNHFLPIMKKEKILIVGQMFQKMKYQGAGSSNIFPYKLSDLSFFDSFYDYLDGYDYSNDEIILDYIEEVKNVLDNYDKVIIFLGPNDKQSSEGYDRIDLSLPKNQLELMKELKGYDNIGVVLTCPGAYELPFIDDVNSVLNVMLAGSGVYEATYKLLYGIACPSGKLSITWPKRTTDIPNYNRFSNNDLELYKEDIYVGYRYFLDFKDKILFPFGYGLSYAKFSYFKHEIKEEKELFKVSAKIKNNSNIIAKETVQLYLKNNISCIDKPIKELKDFAKVCLMPNEEKIVEFIINKNDFSYFDTNQNKFLLQNGEYQLIISSSSLTEDVIYDVFISSGIDVNYEANEKYLNKNIELISDDEFYRHCDIYPLNFNKSKKITLETPFSEYKKPMARLVYKIISGVLKRQYKKVLKMKEFKNKEDVLKNQLFVLEVLPHNNLRSICQSSGGKAQYNIVKGMMHLANGNILRALVSFLKK